MLKLNIRLPTDFSYTQQFDPIDLEVFLFVIIGKSSICLQYLVLDIGLSEIMIFVTMSSPSFV